MFEPSEAKRCEEHAKRNPIESRGRTSISRMAALITDGIHRQFGWNSYKTHPLAFKFSKDHNRVCLHAELNALIPIISRYNDTLDYGDYSLYIARVLKNNSLAMAKPCEACAGALLHYGVKHIYWTIPNGWNVTG